MPYNTIFLAQTDTTAGFLCKDPNAINKAKSAKQEKPLLLEITKLQSINGRVPKRFNTLIRFSKRTSFILPNTHSFRILHDIPDITPPQNTDKNQQTNTIYNDRINLYYHRKFITYFGNLYSSSANPTKKQFNIDFAKQACDIIVLDNRGIFSNKSSQILKIGKKRILKIR